MSRQAKVISIDAVQRMALAVGAFAEEATTTLDYLDLQVKRAVQWIGHECKAYWKQEVKRGWDRVARARAELERCLTFRKAGDHRPGCIDEKKALQEAQRRLRTAEEKLQAARRWEHAIDRQVLELTGTVAQLSDWIRGELPKAVALLERMTDALEGYVTVQPPAAQEEGRVSSAARPGQPADEEARPGAETAEGDRVEEERSESTGERRDDETMGPDHPSGPAEADLEGSPGGSGRGSSQLG